MLSVARRSDGLLDLGALQSAASLNLASPNSRTIDAHSVSSRLGHRFTEMQVGPATETLSPAQRCYPPL